MLDEEDRVDVQHGAPVIVAALEPPPPASVFSPALAALTRPPKVGDVIEHDGRDATVTGTQIRGPGDFSVIIDSGATLHSRG